VLRIVGTWSLFSSDRRCARRHPCDPHCPVEVAATVARVLGGLYSEWEAAGPRAVPMAGRYRKMDAAITTRNSCDLLLALSENGQTLCRRRSSELPVVSTWIITKPVARKGRSSPNSPIRGR